MLKKLLFIALSAFTLNSAAVLADDHDDAASEHIQRAVLTSAIEDREPADDLGNSFEHSGDDYDQVFFFTHVVDHADSTIVHEWHRNGELEAEVELDVGSNSWRTYSSKQIHHLATGQWTVRAVDENGELLAEHQFTVNSQS